MDAKLRKLVTVLVDKKSTEQNRGSAVRALFDQKQAGEAVPLLLAALDTGTAAVQTFVLRAIAAVLAGDATARKTYAAPTIAACCKVATTEVRKTEYRFLQHEAGHPLGALGVTALDAIEALAGHADSGARCAAFAAIYWLREAERAKAAPRVFALVTRGLAHDDVATRRKAAHATNTWGALAAPLVPELHKRLDDDDALVRAAAIDTLAEIGPASAPAIPRLIELSTDKKYVCNCVRALGRIGVDTREVRAAFSAATKLDEPSIPDAVTEALATLTRISKKSAPNKPR